MPASLFKAIKNAKVEISDEEIGPILRGAAINAYNKVISEAAQWSGHMAANLRIEFEGITDPPIDIASDPMYNWRAIVPHGPGEQPAVRMANSANKWIMTEPFTIHSTADIYFINEPDDSYYDKIENRDNVLYDTALYVTAAVRYTKWYREKLKTAVIGGSVI
jgi:hypothetical protein